MVLNLMVSLCIITLIVTMMITLLNLISKKTFMDREKMSPFECGFDPKSSARLPFSLHFFLIAIIFLVFDVELTLLFPTIMTLKYNNLAMHASFLLLFIAVLIMGLLHEWKQGALSWSP